MGSGVDLSMTLHALLGPRDRDNRFLSRFLKQQIIHPALLRGRERCTYPLPKQFPLSLGRPSRGLLLLCLPPVDGGQDGRVGLPTPNSPTPKSSVMIWGAMSSAGVGPLCFLKINVTEPIYQENLPTLPKAPKVG